MKRAWSCTLVAACLCLAAAGSLTQRGQPALSTASPKLDYEFFKAKYNRLRPNVLVSHGGRCHTFNNAPFKGALSLENDLDRGISQISSVVRRCSARLEGEKLVGASLAERRW